MRDAHPSLDRDVPPADVLWRYMDFPKFVSMLKEAALWFSRADRLGDPLEGSFTQARELERQAVLDNPPPGRSREDLEDTFRHNARITSNARMKVYINSWHRGGHESMALWQEYGAGPFAIAARTTFGLLDQLLPLKFSGSGYGSAPTEPDVEPPHAMWIYLTQVRYIDHTSTTERLKDENNMFAPFACKSVSYMHENEVRAVYWNLPGYDTTGERIDAPGLFVPVDLQALITDVVVSPLAPPWFAPLVQSTFERFGFSFAITLSLTSASPVY